MKDQFGLYIAIFIASLFLTTSLRAEVFGEENRSRQVRPIPDNLYGLWDDCFIFQNRDSELKATLKAFEKQTSWKAFFVTQSFLDHETATDFLVRCHEKWLGNDEGFILLYIRTGNQFAIYQTEALRRHLSPFTVSQHLHALTQALEASAEDAPLEQLLSVGIEEMLNAFATEREAQLIHFETTKRNVLVLKFLIIGVLSSLVAIMMVIWVNQQRKLDLILIAESQTR